MPRDADSDAFGGAEFGLDARDQGGDRGDDARIVARRRRHTAAQPDRAVGVQSRRLDFGAADVDSETHRPPCLIR
jgi:hypothetical protein